MKTPHELRQYQDAFAKAIGVQSAFGFWKGRVALYAILKALGIGEGDEIIQPAYTCVMAVNPIVYVGAKPIYVDIEATTYNINPRKIEEKITDKTKAIVAQHTYGLPADMGVIMDIADRRGLPVIEDCCLALGSEYDGRLTGTFGVAAYFSFQWNKPYTSGLGGMAVTNDSKLASRISALQEKSIVPGWREVIMLRAQLAAYHTLVYPWTSALAQNIFRLLSKTGLVIGSSSRGEFTPVMARDFFKRMSIPQARCGLRQLRQLNDNVAYRRRMAAIYDDILRERGWHVPDTPSNVQVAPVRYPVRVADKHGALLAAAKNFVELGSWFECPLHPIETPMEAYGYYTGMCPEADRASLDVVNLPVHRRVGKNTARRSVELITRIGPADSYSKFSRSERVAVALKKLPESLQKEFDDIEESWYVPSLVPLKSGWLVYSLDFILASLQGCPSDTRRVRHTFFWVIIGTLVRSILAIAQVVIMLLSRLPIVSWLIEMLARTFTRNAVGFFMRSCYCKAKLKHLGTDTIIDQGVEIWGPSNVSIGSNCHIDTNVRLAAGERSQRQHGWITVGDFVHLGPGVHIAGRGGVEIGKYVGVMANAHLYSASGVVQNPDDPGVLISMSHMAPHDQQHVVEGPILIDDYAFVGMMARVMPNVTIGRGAVIHANCEVTRDVPPFANIGGVPRGRQIGWRRPRRRSPKLDGNHQNGDCRRDDIPNEKHHADDVSDDV